MFAERTPERLTTTKSDKATKRWQGALFQYRNGEMSVTPNRGKGIKGPDELKSHTHQTAFLSCFLLLLFESKGAATGIQVAFSL